MKRIDRFRAMTVEDVARMIYSDCRIYDCCSSDCGIDDEDIADKDCLARIVKWLEEEE